MIGFTFRNIHSSIYGIGVQSVDRSLIPEMENNEFVIPGRSGTVDFGSNTYKKRPIEVKLGLLKNADFEDLRAKARDIAKWLSGKGNLVFDDELDKAYVASLYAYVGIEQIELMPMGICNILFDCQPLAESLQYNQVNIPEITTKPHEVPVTVSGTYETCCIITIKNTGTTNINNISITRKAAI